MSNNLIVGLTSNDESRGAIGKLFPFVDILQGGTSYMSFGTEPFTVNNELRYKTFQLQDSFTKFGTQHTLTFGATTQRYESENVFWSCCPQSNYTYNSLDDFYTDANDFLRNPNRTTSPVTLRRFKVRYSNVPGLEKPLQPLQVWYSGAYVQDEWRPRRDLTVTAGLRMDVSVFKNTAYQNEKADALTFRDEDGAPVQYQTGEMPDPKILWSPRVGRKLGCRRPRAHAGAAGHGPLHRPAALRVDLEPARQHRRAHRRDSRGQHDGVSVQPESRPLQADERDRRGRRQLRAERHGSRLQVPAGLAHELRASISGCPAASPARSSSSTTRTSTGSTTSTRTCPRRRRRSPGPTTARAGRPTGSTTRCRMSSRARSC